MARNLYYEPAFLMAMRSNLARVGSSPGGGTHSGGASLTSAAGFLPRDRERLTVFLLRGCPHCAATLRKIELAGIGPSCAVHYLDDIGLVKAQLLRILREQTDMDPRHATWPVVFQDGRFLGGNDSLDAHAIEGIRHKGRGCKGRP